MVYRDQGFPTLPYSGIGGSKLWSPAYEKLPAVGVRCRLEGEGLWFLPV